MDQETRDLIDALTTELERCEGTITRLFVLLSRAGLVDEFVTNAVHERQDAILELVLGESRPSSLPGCPLSETNHTRCGMCEVAG